jgi:hypothetical protein
MSLVENSVKKNMQTDDAAFEGWILGMRAIVSDWKFCLSWEEPKDTENGHYQRFLYRVARFNKLFGGRNGWFSLGKENSLEALRINPGNNQFQLNVQTPGTRTNQSVASDENALENKIVNDPNSKLKVMFSIKKLDRQLPVGVFNGEVSKSNAIFTGGKSAVDIWGISTEGALVFFELKVKDNRKIGVLSELFFYAMVLADEQRGVFVRKGYPGEAIRATTSLKAMILAPDIHPIITENVFAMLTKSFNGVIEFGYVKTIMGDDFERVSPK